MQAISTNFIRPTAQHGAQLRASCPAGHVTIAYDHSLSAELNHRAACAELLTKLNSVTPGCWSGLWDGAELECGKFAWICTAAVKAHMLIVQI
jgi:hypothetical protein